MKYKIHPAAAAFPSMPADRFAELKEDIEARGQQYPIVLYQDKVLDGRNRYMACLDLGIDPKIEKYTGSTPYCYVWSVNAQRRDLAQDQRAAIWIKMEPEIETESKTRAQKEGSAKQSAAARAQERAAGKYVATGRATDSGSSGPAKRDSKKANKAKSASAVAKKAGVNRGAVERQRQLRANASDLADKVADGSMKPMEAARELKKRTVIKKAKTEPPSGKYRVIYADPPWDYGAHEQPDYQTEQRDHYPTMPLAEICAMPVRELAEDDAVLFLWVTSPFLEKSFKVVAAWGFQYKAAFIWDKVKHNMGHYNSVRHELLLICTRGSCQPDVRKLFDSVQTIERTEHSRKPVEFYDIIDTIYPNGSRIELFQRAPRKGWLGWGFEAK